MFRKSSLLMMAFMLMLSIVLVACGGNGGGGEGSPAPKTDNQTNEQADATVPEKPASLKMWANDNEQQLAALTQIAENYTNETGIEIEIVPMNFDDQVDNLSLDGPSGTGPDLFFQPHDRTGDIYLQGLAAELDIPEDKYNEYYDYAMESFQFEGIQLGVPSVIETYALFYNKALMPEVPETMDEFMELAKELTQGDQYGFLVDAGNFYFVKPFITGPGGYIFGGEAGNLDSSDIGLNNAGAVEGGELIQSWVQEGLMPADINYDNMASLFEAGKAAAVVNGPWAIPGFQTALGDDLGVALLPKFSNGEVPDSFAGNKGWLVSAFSENQYWATDFALFISNPESSQIYFEGAGEIPARPDVAEAAVVQDAPYIGTFVEQSQYAEPMPNIPEMSQVWDPMAGALQHILQGEDVQDVLDEAVAEIEDQIAIQGQ
ncbi:sugar ABC transporter substrate-binding protein [Halalkalibacter urbisdiaboli]|uniref:sugar ABC transporter substrate-binding protein n=1 Tax=Halalkalibacter urbisdiaboli TaxID=1960589 RepID=UPI000B441F39|nr:extracellular solute-binding protein [Halalkalibacter urbisdiaboli]